ncbi:uncharacterized protein LOC130447884 [Diorhabda sublineata]|uniref:uncharacterized protein LOC130447884 n=1 Tax=Diorhabda sublineata TaxID=1163346 RepID=UPI0024E0533F|nr:uncharacterized protein LOC130447884 [Diorhabda sublineata]
MSDEIVVNTDVGKIRGKLQRDYHDGIFYSFSGIPYAKPPIGELRFKAPEAAEPWEGVRDGTKEGYECPSLDLTFKYHIGHEDNCLNLNIYTKNFQRKNMQLIPKKPVMVFIHGGGFIYGSNKSQLIGPNYLMTENIVFVTINYRLGVFGFLSMTDQSLGVPGNAGLKDQVLALKWVQKHIDKFGGDPNNVTIFGESAGSASVHYLLLSPLSKGLFHKAIMQSGCAFNSWAKGTNNFKAIAKAMGYKDVDEKTVFQKLCRASAKSLVTAQCKIEDAFFASFQRPFVPVVEYPHTGAFLTENPEEIMKNGKYHQVPCIIGYTSMEGLLYELLRRTRNDAGLPENLERDIPVDMNVTQKSEKAKEIAQKMQKFYYEDRDLSEKNINDRYVMLSDTQFLYGIQKTIKLMKRHGYNPVYVYRMSLVSSLNFLKKVCEVKHLKTMLVLSALTKISGGSSLKTFFQNLREKLPVKHIQGVSHADDLFYLFSTHINPSIVRGSEEDKYIQRFVKLWTDFARFGNPTPKPEEIFDNTIWNTVQDESIANIFDINRKITITKNFEEKRVKFWEDMYKTYKIYCNLLFDTSKMSQPIVQVKQGKLLGKILDDVYGKKYYNFLGIPYAKPPLGELRFKAPQPPEKWKGVRDATEEGNECFARQFMEFSGSEDCLYLNVYTRDVSKDIQTIVEIIFFLSKICSEKLKPVMFWIHGGGFTTGSSTNKLYGPDYLIQENVVLVTINYRLGPLGFLALEDPEAGVPGNAAFKDMVMGLKWVQDNIKQFSGDPNNVTIFGESAGAASVHLLILSPMAKGLFHKAILQSGCATNGWALPNKVTAHIFAQKAGIFTNNDKELVKHLQQLTLDELEETIKKLPGLYAIGELFPYGPVIEKSTKEPAFLTEDPIDIIKSGKYNKVPMMIGCLSREGMFIYSICTNAKNNLVLVPETLIPRSLNLRIGSNLHKEAADRVKQFYFGDNDPLKNIDQIYKLYTDNYFLYEVYKTAKLHVETNQHPIFFYRFLFDTELNVLKNSYGISDPGAAHADDCGYLFKSDFVPEVEEGSKEELAIRKTVRLWSNFAKFGKPTIDKKDYLVNNQWLPITKSKFRVFDIGDEFKLYDEHPETKSMLFWDEMHKINPYSSKL